MSVKRYKLALSASSQKIRKAKKTLKQMTKLRKIELMVEAGAMTKRQAEKARKKLAEAPAGAAPG
jgi:hypothetical protein